MADNSFQLSDNGILAAASPTPQAATVQRNTIDVLNNTPLGQPVAQSETQGAYEQALKRDELGFVGTAKAVVDSWDTTHIIQGIEADMRRADDVEGGYRAEDHVGSVMQEYGLEASSGNLKELGRTTSMRDLHETAKTLQGHQQAQQLLADHGMMAFVGGMLDPVWLAMEVGTFGAGSVLNAGRVGRGVIAATQAAGITAAADRMGTDTSLGGYLLNAALAGGFASVFGPNAARTGTTPVGSVSALGPVPAPAPVRGVGRASTIAGEGLESATPVAGYNFDTNAVTKAVNNFTTEFDALTPNPDSLLFSAKIMDDPLGRTAQIQENSAASLRRVWQNRGDGYLKAYEDHIKDVQKNREGMGFFSRTLDWSGKARASRDSFESEVYNDILRRDMEFRKTGATTPHPDPDIAKAVQHVEDMNNFAGKTAKDAGVSGFEDFVERPGYIHRAWNADAAMGAINRYGADTVRDLLSKGLQQSLRGVLNASEAKAISNSMIHRFRALHANEATAFQGQLGKANTESIRELLEESGTNSAFIESIMGKIERGATGESQVKFAKGRLDFDMSATIDTPNGPLSLTDLVHKDVGRISENYVHQMTGRAALAAAGVGADDGAIRKFVSDWVDASLGPTATGPERKAMMEKMQGVVGDFTGIRPDGAKLGAAMQTISGLTSMTVLANSGLWQVGEYGTTAFKFGLRETAKSFVKRAPGLNKLLRKIKSDPDLLQEFNDVANFQLTRDVQFKPWLRQIELNETAKDTKWQRAMHFGKQSIPYVNGMKYIQAHQAQMVGELAVQTLVKAARGHKGALKRLKGHNVSKDTLNRIAENVKAYGHTSGKRVTRLGLGGWAADDVERLTQAAARLMDSGLLMARTGEGSPWQRSTTGQVIGMFRAFVAYSHNKQLRAITANHGVLGLAHIMAYQYPLMYMLQFINDKRKDPKGDGADAGELALQSVGMLGAIGFLGDAAGILGLTGGQGGFSTPAFGVLNNVQGLAKGAKSMAHGDVEEGVWQAGKALTMSTPVIAAFPATKLLVESLKPD